MPLSCATARAVLVFLLLLITPPALAKYDDVLYLKNGDRLSGDVKELSRDMLRYKTDSMGTIYVRWEDIQSIETEKFLRIELKSGRRLVGTLVLNPSGQYEQDRPGGSDDGEALLTAPGGRHDRSECGQGEQRINDRDQVPGNAHIREGPK